MGLLSKLGGAVKEVARDTAVNGILGLTGNGALTGQVNYAEYSYDGNGNIIGVNSKYKTDVANKYGSVATNSTIDGKFGSMAHATPRSRQTNLNDQYPIKYDKMSNARTATTSAVHAKDEQTNGKNNTQSVKGLLLQDDIGSEYKYYNDNNNQNKIASDPISDIYQLKLPDWSYADFINERGMWQKGLSSIFDEPAWFYFKIFFDFNTNHGLFGGLLNSEYLTSATNSAAKYLYSIRKYHKQEKPKDRINALYKFTSILSFINTNAPWYFKGVRNLNSAMSPVIDDFSKERYIEIETMPDAIDMRLSTLMSLYNYACYDSFLGKEIIPENLRKFNMTIILFQTPLRYLHTSYVTNDKLELFGVDVSSITKMFKGKSNKVLYKSLNMNNAETGNFADMMSMHAFSFYGCEFDKESLKTVIPSDISNETPFQFKSSNIKITYSFSTHHVMNEFYGMMFGDDGFYFNQYSNFQLTTPEDGIWSGYVNANKDNWQKQKNRYKALQDTFSDIIGIGVPGPLGSIIPSIPVASYKKAIDATEALMNGLYEENNLLKDIGTNFALGLLGSNMSTNVPQGNLYGDVGINSAYFKDKVDMLKNGVHEFTQAPYYYDPYTGVRVDLHKNKEYSSITKGQITSFFDKVSSFNVGDWLQTKTQELGSKLNDKLRGVVNGKNINTQQPYKPNPYNLQSANEIDKQRFGETGKTHILVDNIGNERHEYTQKPFAYNPINAVDYENSKAGGQGKTQDLTDKIDNAEHEVTEKPFAYDPINAVDYENSKAGGQGKTQDLTDKIGNPEHEVTEKPFAYDPMNAVDYENSKAGGQGKTQDLTDKIGNPEHEVTEKPFAYDPMSAVDYENSKAGGEGKTQDLIDKIGNDEHEYTEAPFAYDAKGAVDYENGKAGGEGKTQVLVDKIGNDEHEYTEAPFAYDAAGAVDYENGKAGGEGKVQDMVDKIGNPEHEFTEIPFAYDAAGAVDYENSKAGGQYKTQEMVDGIGNPEHEVTEAPFAYDPMNAVNYENSKAGGLGKTQELVDKIGNPEHEVTEKPFAYDSMNAVNYENSKAGGPGKTQDLVDKIGNPEHEVTEKPFAYDPMNAVKYENSKAGGPGKTQDLVDKIGNPEHEYTEPPYDYDEMTDVKYEPPVNEHNFTQEPFAYDPMNAVNYENSKAGIEKKDQSMVDVIGNPPHEFTEPPYNYDPLNDKLENDNEHNFTQAPLNYVEKKDHSMVDGLGNPEHEYTEPPYAYDPMTAVNYENSKAGGEGMNQLMVDIIGNPEHEFTEPPYAYNPSQDKPNESNNKE